MYSRKEYEEKQQALTNFARSVDIWKSTPQTAEQKKWVSALWEQLQAETFALECAFLDKKTEIFTQILKVLKKEK